MRAPTKKRIFHTLRVADAPPSSTSPPSPTPYVHLFFPYLDGPSLLECQRVCKAWHKKVNVLRVWRDLVHVREKEMKALGVPIFCDPLPLSFSGFSLDEMKRLVCSPAVPTTCPIPSCVVEGVREETKRRKALKRREQTKRKREGTHKKKREMKYSTRTRTSGDGIGANGDVEGGENSLPPHHQGKKAESALNVNISPPSHSTPRLLPSSGLPFSSKRSSLAAVLSPSSSFSPPSPSLPRGSEKEKYRKRILEKDYNLSSILNNNHSSSSNSNIHVQERTLDAGSLKFSLPSADTHPHYLNMEKKEKRKGKEEEVEKEGLKRIRNKIKKRYSSCMTSMTGSGSNSVWERHSDAVVGVVENGEDHPHPSHDYPTTSFSCTSSSSSSSSSLSSISPEFENDRIRGGENAEEEEEDKDDLEVEEEEGEGGSHRRVVVMEGAIGKRGGPRASRTPSGSSIHTTSTTARITSTTTTNVRNGGPERRSLGGRIISNLSSPSPATPSPSLCIFVPGAAAGPSSSSSSAAAAAATATAHSSSFPLCSAPSRASNHPTTTSITSPTTPPGTQTNTNPSSSRSTSAGAIRAGGGGAAAVPSTFESTSLSLLPPTSCGSHSDSTSTTIATSTPRTITTVPTSASIACVPQQPKQPPPPPAKGEDERWKKALLSPKTIASSSSSSSVSSSSFIEPTSAFTSPSFPALPPSPPSALTVLSHKAPPVPPRGERVGASPHCPPSPSPPSSISSRPPTSLTSPTTTTTTASSSSVPPLRTTTAPSSSPHFSFLHPSQVEIKINQPGEEDQKRGGGGGRDKENKKNTDEKKKEVDEEEDLIRERREHRSEVQQIRIPKRTRRLMRMAAAAAVAAAGGGTMLRSASPRISPLSPPMASIQQNKDKSNHNTMTPNNNNPSHGIQKNNSPFPIANSCFSDILPKKRAILSPASPPTSPPRTPTRSTTTTTHRLSPPAPAAILSPTGKTSSPFCLSSTPPRRKIPPPFLGRGGTAAAFGGDGGGVGTAEESGEGRGDGTTSFTPTSPCTASFASFPPFSSASPSLSHQPLFPAAAAADASSSGLFDQVSTAEDFTLLRTLLLRRSFLQLQRVAMSEERLIFKQNTALAMLQILFPSKRFLSAWKTCLSLNREVDVFEEIVCQSLLSSLGPPPRKRTTGDDDDEDNNNKNKNDDDANPPQEVGEMTRSSASSALLSSSPRIPPSPIPTGIHTFVQMELYCMKFHHSRLAARWKEFQKKFPLDDVYYNARDLFVEWGVLWNPGKPMTRTSPPLFPAGLPFAETVPLDSLWKRANPSHSSSPPPPYHEGDPHLDHHHHHQEKEKQDGAPFLPTWRIPKEGGRGEEGRVQKGEQEAEADGEEEEWRSHPYALREREESFVKVMEEQILPYMAVMRRVIDRRWTWGGTLPYDVLIQLLSYCSSARGNPKSQT